jgi:DNA-binding MarR family transcriptional regulator
MTRRLRAELQQTKPFASLEEEVFLEIQRTSQISVRWVVDALKPTGLTPSQFNVLRILRGARPDALSASVIAERMVAYDPDLTRLLDRLEAGKLIEKSRDARDRRVVNITITKTGVAAVEKATNAVRGRLQVALGSMGTRKLELLADLLELARGSSD